MNDWTALFVVIIFAWLVFLTAHYVVVYRRLKGLKLENGDSLASVVERILSSLTQMNAKYDHVLKLTSTLFSESQRSIQKVVLKRFNPFDDSGGDQSFSLVLLDKQLSGVIISSLHGRSGTRIYAKPVRAGKEVNYELSQEEKDILNLALQQKHE